jgi:NitT/TauT family transport system permease protein
VTAAITAGGGAGTTPGGSAGRLGRLLASPALVAPLVVLVAVTALWQAGVFHALFGFKAFTVPYPSAIVGAVPDSGQVILDAVGVTLQGALIGYAVGMSFGFLIGSALVRFVPGLVGRILPLLSATNALPIVAVAPLVSLFTGPGVPLKVIVVTIMTAPVMTVYTVRGLREVDPTMLEMMASLDATPGQVYRMVQVRTALPFLFTALKSSVVLALIGTIVSEAVRGFEGLGWVIVDSIPEWRAPKGWLALIVIAAVGIAWYVAVEVAERVVLPWEVANRRRE